MADMMAVYNEEKKDKERLGKYKNQIESHCKALSRLTQSATNINPSS